MTRANDAWQAETYRQAALAIGRWLEERGRLDEPIAKLQLHELVGMAYAAIGRYTDLREERRRELALPMPIGAEPDLLDA